ncbi:hypothetical protein ATCC90586_005639 [Pythium insidiosum]|nr:hypothetical protein ATCC90586_005639 [Pythium insidiosum]
MSNEGFDPWARGDEELRRRSMASTFFEGSTSASVTPSLRRAASAGGQAPTWGFASDASHMFKGASGSSAGGSSSSDAFFFASQQQQQHQSQPHHLHAAPPLPPPPPHQLYHQQTSLPPPPPQQQAPQLRQHHSFDSFGAAAPAGRSRSAFGFDLTQSMGELSLSSAPAPSPGAAAPPAASPTRLYERSSSFGAIGSPTPSTLSSSSPWGFDSDRLRDQMNQQMAALYRSSGGGPADSEAARQPLAPSGEALLSLLHNGSSAASPTNGRPELRHLDVSSPLSRFGAFSGHDMALSAPPMRSSSSSSLHHQPPAPPPPLPPSSGVFDFRSADDDALRGLHFQHQHQHQPHHLHREFPMQSPPPMHHQHHAQQQTPPRSARHFREPGFLEVPRPPRSFNGFDAAARREQPSPLYHQDMRHAMGAAFSMMPSAGGGGGGHSTAVVSPDVTKPNDTIKVQVSLLTDECRPGRVLLIGLFRIGQPTNEKPIFVKQVLFENKISRQARQWNTRITFRAPRSPGEFEFRIFEELKPRPSHGSGSRTPGGGSSRDVSMDYSHFIEFLRSITEKFRQNRLKRDTGGILSNLLAFMRLIDQIETVFLHGEALLEDFIDDLLGLVSLDDDEMARFPATDTIPNPMETFHGTIRNVLNAVECNACLHEFVSPLCWQQISYFQRHRYDAVSGLYFANDDAKAAYWQRQFGFTPPQRLERAETDSGDSASPAAASKVLTSSFVTDELSQWMLQQADALIPDRTAFRQQRQSIVSVVFNEVVCHLDVAELVDVSSLENVPSSGRIVPDLDVFGSSANDFGTWESDMDMCLVLPTDVVSRLSVDDKRRVLSKAVSLLEARPDLFTDIDTSRLTARIPIVIFRMRESGVECDLCVENQLAQRNTSLLRAYANADDRVRVLAYVLKQFVKRRRMNCAAESTLSTYGYLLMLIHFLQRQDPPIVPVLQTLHPTWKGDYGCACSLSDGRSSCPPRSPDCCLTEREALRNTTMPSVLARAPGGAVAPLPMPDALGSTPDGASSNPANGQVETYFFDPFGDSDPSEKLQVLHNAGARNEATVGELFVRFLEFYGLVFDASRSVVTVRMGRELAKSEKKTLHQWKLHSRLSIEDPFETSYDVAHVLKGTRDKYIRQQFVRAFALLVDAASSRQDEAASSDSRKDVEAVMAEVMEPVNELPFHLHKEPGHHGPQVQSPHANGAHLMRRLSAGTGLFDGFDLALPGTPPLPSLSGLFVDS